jgi:excinuclease UvrABC ATPase subunit
MAGAEEYIEVLGARVHNLKNIDVRIPRDQAGGDHRSERQRQELLAFDTIHAEGTAALHRDLQRLRPPIPRAASNGPMWT